MWGLSVQAIAFTGTMRRLCTAGLAAYASWQPALEHLRLQQVPFVVSDYNEEALHGARQVLAIAGMATAGPVAVNSFCSPVSLAEPSNRLPCYSNAFMLAVRPGQQAGQGLTRNDLPAGVPCTNSG